MTQHFEIQDVTVPKIESEVAFRQFKSNACSLWTISDSRPDMFTRHYCKIPSSTLMSPDGHINIWPSASLASSEYQPGLSQQLDPGSSSDPPHPGHRGKMVSAPGRWTHTGQALAASPYFCWHCGRHPWIYQWDAVRHQVGGRLCWLSWTSLLILGVSDELRAVALRLSCLRP